MAIVDIEKKLDEIQAGVVDIMEHRDAYTADRKCDQLAHQFHTFIGLFRQHLADNAPVSKTISTPAKDAAKSAATGNRAATGTAAPNATPPAEAPATPAATGTAAPPAAEKTTT